MDIRKIFGANIRHHRTANGLKQEELAGKAELSGQMIGLLERGKTGASFDNIEAIARALGVPAIMLFSNSLFTTPEGERGELLHRLNIALAKLNDDDLKRIVRALEAYAE